VVDYGEYKTGQRSESIIFSVQTMLVKFAGALSGFFIGIGLTNLHDHRADSADLLDPSVAKRAAAERASDAARAKFGKDAVVTGRAARIAKAREIDS